MLYKILFTIIILLATWTAVSYFFERGIEEPAYTVIEKRDGYEIRQYEPYIVAQVNLPDLPYREAVTKGFTILAAYIFGDNKTQQEFAMTAPVFIEESTELAMTAPVFIESQTMSFVMPSQYTRNTLPIPNDDRVTITEIPGRTVAVLTFSWWRTENRIAEKEGTLRRYLERDGEEIRKIEYAGYNAPFTAPWLNRNEILIEI